MAKILDMPKLSPTMEEGVLATWHKKAGDAVEVDDLLAEVETDKATMEFRAFDKGTLLKLLVEAGATVKLGQPVAILGKEGEDISGLDPSSSTDASPKSEAPKSENDAAPKETSPEETSPEEASPKEASPQSRSRSEKDEDAPVETPRSPKKETEKKEKKEAPKEKAKVAPTMRPPARVSVLSRTEQDVTSAPTNDRVLASPYVRKVARERGIDLSVARGSGDHGRIVPSDLETISEGKEAMKPTVETKALARTPQAALARPGLAEPEARPLSPMRKTIARRLTQAKQTVPHFYLTIDVDAEELVLLRERINADLAAAAPKSRTGESPKPEKISLNDLILKASAAALVRVPECNAQYTDEAILVHRRVDISVAVAIPDGLVTPVLRNADQKSVVAIAREVKDLAARARTKKLKAEEMSDGTFSISNLGMFGIDSFSAVINPPEGAILAVGQVRDEPVVKDGVVKPGKKLALTLSCDHRVVDGAIGASFLAELRDLLEHPMRILTG